MRNIKHEDTQVQFPKKEKAYAVIPVDRLPFSDATVGVTYPYSEYSIERAPGHSIHVLEYVLSGAGEIFLDGVWKKVKADEVYILRAGEAHRYRADRSDPWKKMWINYHASYISALLDAYALPSGIYAAPGAKYYFEEAFEAARSGLPQNEIAQLLTECVHKIIALASAGRHEERESDAFRIREALGAMLYQKCNLDDLAAKLHLSKSNMIRIFKKQYGVTPYEYLLSAKIEAAKALLSNTQLSVKAISERLQILDEHYFSTLFTSRVGLCPRDFRKCNGMREK